MSRHERTGQGFLSLVEQRESALLETLLGADVVACETGLEHILGQAR